MSFNPDKSHTLAVSLRKDHLANPPIYFLYNPLEAVQSFKLLGLSISHSLSWANHISKLASKISCRLGILRRTKSLFDTPELLSTYTAFIRSLMEYCSPLWAGSPASHLAQLDARKPRPSRLLEFPTMKLSLWAYHFAIAARLVVSLSFTVSSLVLHPLLMSRFVPGF